jgi:hypothetical protein
LVIVAIALITEASQLFSRTAALVHLDRGTRASEDSVVTIVYTASQSARIFDFRALLILASRAFLFRALFCAPKTACEAFNSEMLNLVAV